MAITVTLDPQPAGMTNMGAVSARFGTLTLDSSYPTGGYAVAKGDFQLSVSLHDVDVSLGGGYVFDFDRANSKLRVWYGDNNNASDGPLIEVPNGTNLASVTARFRAYGTGS